MLQSAIPLLVLLLIKCGELRQICCNFAYNFGNKEILSDDINTEFVSRV